MIFETVPLPDIVDRLARNGHKMESCANSDSKGARVVPTEHNVINVALEPDPVLKLPYRQRYFVCRADAGAILQRSGCRSPLSCTWMRVLARITERSQQDFIAGPATWVLTQLSRNDGILVWANEPIPWRPYYVDELAKEYGIRMKRESMTFFGAASTEGGKGLLIGVHSDILPTILAGCFLLTSMSDCDCFVTDEACTEVYIVHHHERVMLSIPGDERRHEILSFLRSTPDLFTDISGYQLDSESDAIR